MNDSELKDLLQDAMRKVRPESPPAFDVAWAAAGARHRRSRRYAALGGTAAAIALVAIVALVTGLPPGERVPPDDEYMIADALLNSTHWQAPSDALLPQYRDDIYGEIPPLMESTDINEGSLL